MRDKKLSNIILSKKLLQVRHDHFLEIGDLSGLSGLTDIQIHALEEGINKENCFVDDEHAIDCVKRVSNSLGFSKNYFLSKKIKQQDNHEQSLDKENQEILVCSSSNKKKLNNSNPLTDLNILSNLDFVMISQKLRNKKNNGLKFFLGFFSNSPSLMAPIVIVLVAIFYMIVSLI